MPDNEDLILCDKFVAHFKKIYLKMRQIEESGDGDGQKYSLGVKSIAQLTGVYTSEKGSDHTEEDGSESERSSSS
jgi:hypothetical protein